MFFKPNKRQRSESDPPLETHNVMKLWAVPSTDKIHDEHVVSTSSVMPQQRSPVVVSLVPADHCAAVLPKASRPYKAGKDGSMSTNAMALITSISSSHRVVVIDVETTGFHYPRRIMEIAAVEMCEGELSGFLFHRIVNASQSLALERSSSGSIEDNDSTKKPEDVHPRARAVHAIMPNDEHAGGEEAAVMRQFLRFCVGNKASSLALHQNDWSSVRWPVMVGHNASFDIAIVNEHLARVLGAPPHALIPLVKSLGEVSPRLASTDSMTLCTMQLFRWMFPVQATGGTSLDAVAQFFAVRGRDDRALSGHHGALTDASMTAKIFCSLRAIAVDASESGPIVEV
ncbi:exonuclease, putative [Bodo saltans]|uniref:Exonuclease, putative n=1 Tax=Bodo saltans TaxID=75058 RepID=A0A0S4IVW6_BODSA|nr:exonuclease, putative [Bodo saltans]|eukprot:CUF94138.1 exonuclease, putative [Bodo saltans]